MPLFDKQEGHCLRISTHVVKWHEREDVRRVTDWMAWDGGRAVELRPKIGSAIREPV